MITINRKIVLGVSMLSVLIAGCKKEVGDKGLESPFQSKGNTTVINEVGTINGLSYIDLLNDFQKPAEVVVHIQSYNTLGNQMTNGLPSLSIYGGVSLKDNKHISLNVNGKLWEAKGKSISYQVEPQYKPLYQPLYGATVKCKLANEIGELVDFNAYLPKQPKITLNGYEPGVGLFHNINSDLNINWERDPTNELGALLITLSLPNTNGEEVYILVPDNGSYLISNNVFQKFKGNEYIDISLSRGAYKRVKLASPNSGKSLRYYSIVHTHFGVNLEE